MRQVPIFDQLFIGRECAGISERRRLVILDPGVSRNHLEIRLVGDTDQAFIIDTSTNGTLLNGVGLQRAVMVPVRPDDRIEIAGMSFTFRSDRFTATTPSSMSSTRPNLRRDDGHGVGDIANYATISEVTDATVVAESLNHLWRELGSVLRRHRGTLTNKLMRRARRCSDGTSARVSRRQSRPATVVGGGTRCVI